MVSSFATHSIQNPGHMTNGRMHKCRHIGTRPPINEGSSRACATEQRGNNEEHFTGNTNHQIHCTGTLILCQVECSLLMYAEKQALYISSLVRPTFRTYVVGKLAMYPSSMASVTSAIEPSAAVIYKDSNAMTATWVAGLKKSVSSLDTTPIQNNCDH